MSTVLGIARAYLAARRATNSRPTHCGSLATTKPGAVAGSYVGQVLRVMEDRSDRAFAVRVGSGAEIAREAHRACIPREPVGGEVALGLGQGRRSCLLDATPQHGPIAVVAESVPPRPSSTLRVTGYGATLGNVTPVTTCPVAVFGVPL